MLVEWVDVAGENDVTPGECIGLIVKGIAVALVRADAAHWYALNDLCTHGDGRLSEGYVENGCIECPLHSGLFDLATGEPRSVPITEKVKTYPVRCFAGRVEIAV